MAFTFGQSSTSGGTSAPTASPFAFGAPQQSSQNNLFGGGQPPQQQQQQQPQTSLFGGQGQQQQPSQQTGLFGSQQQQQQPQQNSLFGSQQQQQQQPQQNSLFGSQQQPQTSSNLFGAPQQQQGTSSLFGSKPLFGGQSTTTGQQQPPNPLTLSQLGGGAANYQQSSGSGLFSAGVGNNNTLGASTNVNQNANTNAGDKRRGLMINDKIEAMRAAWDMQNIQTCQFLYYFYNALPAQPSNIGQFAAKDPNFGRRQDAIGPRHEAMWAQTLRENPDRTRLVPVLAIGFSDVKARVELQEAESSRQSVKLTELKKRLDELTAKHALSNSVRFSAISRKQTSLHHRLLSLAKRIHLLIPALRGHSISSREEQLKSLLQACEMELESRSSSQQPSWMASSNDISADAQHHLRGKINELWAILGTIKAKRDATTGTDEKLVNGSVSSEWAVVDQSAIAEVAKILASQQQGLDHLTSTLQSDGQVLDTIVKGLEGVELVGVK